MASVPNEDEQVGEEEWEALTDALVGLLISAAEGLGYEEQRRRAVEGES